MLDETITLESEPDLARPQAAQVQGRTRVKASKKQPVPGKMEIPQAREIVLRLIELIKQV